MFREAETFHGIADIPRVLQAQALSSIVAQRALENYKLFDGHAQVMNQRVIIHEFDAVRIKSMEDFLA
jgi:hypothetical protein